MSRPEANMAVAEISLVRLDDLLQLPPGVRVVGLTWDMSRDAVLFKLEGKGLPLVRPGDCLMTITPTLRTGPPRFDWPIT